MDAASAQAQQDIEAIKNMDIVGTPLNNSLTQAINDSSAAQTAAASAQAAFFCAGLRAATAIGFGAAKARGALARTTT